MDNEFLVALPLLKSLLDDERLELSEKQLLFSQNLDKLTKQETIEQLSQLNMGEFLEVFERKNPKFRKTVITENILNSFHKKDWVGKIKEEELGGLIIIVHIVKIIAKNDKQMPQKCE